MKLTNFIIMSLLTTTLFSATAMAASNNILRYGEIIRPDTFDPYTSREMSSRRLVELMFNGLLSIDKKQQIIIFIYINTSYS